MYWRLKFANGEVKLEDIPSTYRPSKTAIAMGNLEVHRITGKKYCNKDLTRIQKLSRERKCLGCEILLSSRFAGKSHNGVCDSCTKRNVKIYA